MQSMVTLMEEAEEEEEVVRMASGRSVRFTAVCKLGYCRAHLQFRSGSGKRQSTLNRMTRRKLQVRSRMA